MGAELQQKLIPLFHYALNPGGVLFLGNSESAGEAGQYFSAVDHKAKVYRRNDDGVVGRIASLPLTPSGAVRQGVAGRKAAPAAKAPLRELAEREMLNHAGLVGALVDERGDVLYLHGRTGLYLEPPPGESGASNILRMAREGLRPALASALRKAAATKTIVRAPGQRVKTNSHFAAVDVTVRPVARAAAGEAPLFAVILEEAPAAARPPKTPAPRKNARGATPPESAAVVAALKEELRAKEEYLRSANEELQSTTEELQSSNEEMQSVNEELQSTNEELETSKEELQSVNEELSTVNAELQTKVLSLSQANNDMNNLMAGTGIGTVFVDHQLRIVRFTPAVSPLLNLIQSDLGRPVAHIVSNLAGYDRLVDDARQVLDTLVPKEQEVRTKDGGTFSMRIMPYRTLENVIEGAVISFLDISEMVRAREALRQANDLFRLAVVVRESQDALTVQDLDGRIIAWNPGAERMYGWSESEALGMNMRDLIPPDAREEESLRTARTVQGEIVPAHAARRLAKDGKGLAVEATATALIDGTGKVYAIASTERIQEARE